MDLYFERSYFVMHINVVIGDLFDFDLSMQTIQLFTALTVRP